MTPGAGRLTPWQEVNRRFPPTFVASRYVRLVERRARTATLASFAGSAREDLTRLAGAVTRTILLHRADPRERCRECSRGPFLVDWPCNTRRAVDDGLCHDRTALDLAPGDTEPGPDAHEGFALAMIAAHDVLPAAAGHPARCRVCGTPPGECHVWALAEGFLGMQPPR